MEPNNTVHNREKVGKGNPPRNTRWKPGQSGNPKGRPKGIRYISESLRELLDQKDKDGRTNAQLIAEALIEAAKNPNSKMASGLIKEILDRTEGKVPDKVEETDTPVTIIFKRD